MYRSNGSLTGYVDMDQTRAVGLGTLTSISGSPRRFGLNLFNDALVWSGRTGILNFSGLRWLLVYNLSFHCVRGDEVTDLSKADACLRCRRFFVSRAAWAVHASKVHGRTNKCRSLIAGTRCESCMKEYGTTARLLSHLWYSKQCYNNLKQAGHRFNLQPGRGSTQEDTEGPFVLPVMKSSGPQPEELQDDVIPK